MKPTLGIAIKGKDGAIGMTEAELSEAIDARLEVIERYGLVGGGSILGEGEIDFIADYDGDEPLTVDMWLAFAEEYHRTFPSFEGDIYLTNTGHVPTHESNKTLVDLFDEYPDLMTMDGYDDCIVGVVHQFGCEPILCYDQRKVIKKLMQSMTEDEAWEFHEFNQLGAYVGEKTPCFITMKEQ